MLSARRNRFFSFFLIGTAIGSAACRSSEEASAHAGLVVVNATKTGVVRRVLVREESEVTENTVLLEIAVPLNNPILINANRPPIENPARNQNKAIAEAERQLEQAAVETQRVELLVAANSAPQSQLDAARAQYQQAQERLDQLRRAPLPPINPNSPQSNNIPAANAPPTETLVAVRAPVAGNVRVISARIGQTVEAGEPVATISTAR